jgi:hypothetical protein
VTGDVDGQVQLGDFDVPASVLAVDGVSLIDLIGVEGAAAIDDLLSPPATGWRVIEGDLNAPAGQSTVIAAPWPGIDTAGWMLIAVTHRAGRRSSVVHGDRFVIRPGRSRRRSGLALEWIHPVISTPAATSPTLTVRLRNNGPQEWLPDGQDSQLVFGWLLGRGGARIRRSFQSDTMAAFPYVPLAPVRPGDAVDLPVVWQSDDISSLPKGKYLIVAELIDLRLESRLAELRLH